MAICLGAVVVGVVIEATGATYYGRYLAATGVVWLVWISWIYRRR